MSDRIAKLEKQLADAQTQRAEIDALNNLAWELRDHQTARALALAQKAYDLSTAGEFLAQPYALGLATSLTTRAFVNRTQGKLDLALDECFQAVALLDSETPSRVAIDSLRLISWVYYFLGDHSNALDYGLRALGIARAGKFRIQEASVLDVLAMIHVASEDLQQATEDHNEALQIARAEHDETLEAVVLNNRANVLLEQGEYGRALELGNKSWEIARRLEMNERRADIADTLGQILQQLGEFERAEELLNQALAIDMREKQALGQAYTLLSLGGLHLAQQNLARAESDFRQSLEIATRIGIRSIQLECYANLTRVAQQQGLWEQAFNHHKAFHESYKELHSEKTSKRLALLKVAYQVETAKRDTEIYRLRNLELVRENAELEKRVAERTARLESALGEIESFSYSISHDLRAPLRAINGYAGILLADTQRNFSPEVIKKLIAIKNNGQRMGQLVDGLLEFLRSGNAQIERQIVYPGEIVQSVLERLRPEYENRQVEIMVGDLPPCSANLRLLDKVYEGLISNAIKFTRNCDTTHIAIDALEKDGQQVYFVRDNGTGFDMQYYSQLFGVFQRLHHVSEFEGIGASLAIIQRIIQRHNGRIWAEAEPDKGATFYFTLPAVPTAPAS